MTLDDFFGDTQKAWEELQKQRAEEAKQKEEQERQQRIDELKARREGKKTPASESVIPTVTSLADYIKLENISCVDADGNFFEHYPELYVRKDIETYPDHNSVYIHQTPYQWISYFEGKGSFLPSFALTCNILAALFQRKDEPEMETVILQYRNKEINGWHAQNTIVDYATEKIIHYPHAVAFDKEDAVNLFRPTRSLPFAKNALEDGHLVDALRDPPHRHFIKQLTGLSDPSILLDIGNWLGSSATILFPWSGSEGSTYTQRRAALLGTRSHDLFCLHVRDPYGAVAIARDVRFSLPEGAP